MQGLDVWRNPQIYVVGTSPLCGRIPGLSAGQRKLCQLRQVSPQLSTAPSSVPVARHRPLMNSLLVIRIED